VKAKFTLKWISLSALLILIGGVTIYRIAQWYYCLPPLTSYLIPGACLTVDEATYRNIDSAEFHAVDTNCDTLAKEEFVEVYAYRNDAHTVLPKWLRKRTVVFVYDPLNSDEALPAISAPQPGHILIAVSRVSSVEMRKSEWNGHQIDYKIGQVEYP
jgi:hypothetical protein